MKPRIVVENVSVEFPSKAGPIKVGDDVSCSDERSVVDPRLRVRGVEGLRVIDASVMPTVTSANTDAASLMIGEKGARLVIEGR